MHGRASANPYQKWSLPRNSQTSAKRSIRSVPIDEDMKNGISSQLEPFRILVGFAAFVVLAIGFLAVGITTAMDMSTASDA